MRKIPIDYYRQKDVVFLAQDLIGKQLFTLIDGSLTGGMITETEAYRGWGDKACHSHAGRRTKRTSIMYESGGLAYVYLCYGIHHLFNIITNTEENADAILIRAIEPAHGVETMLKRRNKLKVDKTLTAGPGSMSMALGITTRHYGTPLNGNKIWLEEADRTIPAEEITATTRVGIDYAEEDALLPWRFYHTPNTFISKK